MSPKAFWAWGSFTALWIEIAAGKFLQVAPEQELSWKSHLDGPNPRRNPDPASGDV